MAIEIAEHAEGAVLSIKAQPGSRAAGLRGERAGALCVAVTEVAEKGKANEAVIALVARELNLKRAAIELIRGGSSKAKRLLIRDVTPTQLAAKIQRALARD
jgi:uncharacterized protein